MDGDAEILSLGDDLLTRLCMICKNYFFAGLKSLRALQSIYGYKAFK